VLYSRLIFLDKQGAEKRAKMKYVFRFSLPIFLLALTCITCTENPTYAREDPLLHFFKKDEVRIAITDSGLGGLSILADAVERSRSWKSFKKVDFVFFNALFSNQGGYNSLQTHQEKVSIFDSALDSLKKRYNPDLILIGCNTLSTIYGDTAFVRRAQTPVVGIIGAGVDIAADALKEYPGSTIILFATQTTIAQNTHQERLIKKGFLPERIVCQACPELAEYIETDYRGEETEMLILAYADEALRKISNHNDPMIVSLNCTHYGYSLDLWKKAFQSLGIKPAAILNPNPRINDFLFKSQFQDRFKNTDISVRVVSMVEIADKKRESLGAFLRSISPQTAEALHEYEWIDDLFEWKSFLNK
jgi:glutamate racemase